MTLIKNSLRALIRSLIYFASLPIIIHSAFKWNSGICRKCKNGRYEMVDYDSDRILSGRYECDNCHDKFKTVANYEKISKEEFTIRTRNTKLSKILD